MIRIFLVDDCDVARAGRLDGFLFAEDAEGVTELDKELEAAHRAGLLSVERLDQPLIANHPLTPCLRFPNQGQFHVLKYLTGLAARIQRFGGRIYENTHADVMQASDD